MTSLVPEHDDIAEASILEIANQHFEIVRSGDGRVRRAMGMESAIGIPEQAKSATRTWRRPFLNHEETVPTCIVRINHPDWTGEILPIAQDFFGCIDKPDSDSFLVRLLQLERHPGLGVLAPLECGGARRGLSGVGLVQLNLLLRLILPTRAEERLGQQVMRRRVEMVWVQSNTFLERGDGSIPLFQPHPGPPKLKGCRRLYRINPLRVFQGLRRFLPVRSSKVCRAVDNL